MKIAVPTDNGVVYPHFGHCPTFTFYEIDLDSKKYKKLETLTPPPHDPGVIPAWIGQLGCDLIIAGGMGQRALDLFHQYGVQVIPGVPPIKADDAIKALLENELRTGSNPCNDPDFHHNHGGQCHNS